MAECQSYRRDHTTCKDGFIQRHKCWNWTPCQCGEFTAAYMPFCMTDSLPAHMADDAGGPAYYKAPKP